MEFRSIRNSVEFAKWLEDNHSGKENAINACNMKQWGSRREIRHMTHELRLSGYAICSGQSGYYHAVRPSEISETLSFLISIQDDLLKIIAGLNKTLSHIEDQR